MRLTYTRRTSAPILPDVPSPLADTRAA
jgi:hypothetical protein